MATSERLGPEARVELPQGTLVYRDRGEGPPIVFIHGALVNGDLWHKVVPGIASAGYRCITPDLPLGAHTVPARADADLSPPGMADLVADFLAALDLQDVTLVANDTGGAITQILIARRPERVGRVVLTTSDTLECFFPPVFRFLQWMGWVPGGTWIIANVSRIRVLERNPLVFGWLSKHAFSSELRRSFGASARRREIRRDLAKFLRRAHRRHTLAAAGTFPKFGRPVLLVWAKEDRLFPVRLAHRLLELFPDARLETVEDSYTFVSLDQPERLVEHITGFLSRTASAS